jgi:osmotically-inducible protein OsmY
MGIPSWRPNHALGAGNGYKPGMDSSESVPDVYLVEHIRDAMAQDPRLSELHVDITVTSGKVFLTGSVASEERRACLTTVVRDLLPDREVVNHTSIDAPADEPDVEKLS